MLLIQITAAHGPTECEYAARLTLRELLPFLLDGGH